MRGAPTQLAFAPRLGITREQLSRIESGAQVPSTETLRRLAQVTGVSLNFVLLGEAAEGLRPEPAESGEWTAALAPLLAATSLRLPPVATAAGRRADRAWRELPDHHKDDLRAFVRRIAAAAVVLEALLPAGAARTVNDALSAVLATVLVDRIAAARDAALADSAHE